MAPNQVWLRQLDSDALSGKVLTRRVIVVPLALFVGVLVGAGLGFTAGFVWSLPPAFAGSYGVIASPFIGGAAGVLVGGVLAGVLALRGTR